MDNADVSTLRGHFKCFSNICIVKCSDKEILLLSNGLPSFSLGFYTPNLYLNETNLQWLSVVVLPLLNLTRFKYIRVVNSNDHSSDH